MTQLARTLPVDPLLDWRILVSPLRWDVAVSGEDLDGWIASGRIPVGSARRVVRRLDTTIGDVWYRSGSQP